MAKSTNCLQNGKYFWSFRIAKLCIFALTFADLGSTSDFEPSAENIRRYIALYEHRQNRNAAKPLRHNVPESLGLKLVASDVSDNVDHNLPKVPEVYGPYERWLLAKTRQPEVYPPSGRFSWYQGGGQPEVVANDEEIIEDPSDQMIVQAYPPREDIPGENLSLLDEQSNSMVNEDQFRPILSPEQKKAQELGISSISREKPNHLSSPSDSNIPVAQSRIFDKAVADEKSDPLGDIYFVVIVAGCSAVAIFGVVSAGYCFYRFQKNNKAAAEVDYPAYGVTGPSKEHATSPSGDRRLAQSAQMYHYQHQKQQMIAVEKATTVRNTSASDVDSEEENEEGDYTVYECPGLAPTGEMEVKNPLFHDDSTPMSPPITSKETLKKP